MKLGLVTQYNWLNYGNRLQNYATNYILKKMDYDDVESLIYLPSRFLSFFNFITKPLFFLSFRRRMNSFIKFTKKYIKSTKIENKSVKSLNKRYGKNGQNELDCLILGSDQTWNPSYMVNAKKNFGAFVEKEKRISYSTSFGVSTLPESKKDSFKKYLQQIDYISVRETAGAKIVKELTNKDCPVLLDPTMMLTKEEWAELAKDSKLEIKDKYIFCYFLTMNKAYRKYVKDVAKENGLKIIDINKVTSKYFDINPADFIYLIMHASLVCTDSFHGHAFSICLEKPFISFPSSKAMISRLQTILGLTKLEDRNYITLDNKNIFNIDYKGINEIIDVERTKAKDYLKNAIDSVASRNKND